MTTAAFGGSPFSTHVELWIETPHGNVHLSHVEPETVIACENKRLPPCNGVVVVSIDGELHRRDVVLAEGMSPEVTETPVRAMNRVAASSK